MAWEKRLKDLKIRGCSLLVMDSRARASFELAVECACFLIARIEESENDTDMQVVCGKPPQSHHSQNFAFEVIDANIIIDFSLEQVSL